MKEEDFKNNEKMIMVAWAGFWISMIVLRIIVLKPLSDGIFRSGINIESLLILFLVSAISAIFFGVLIIRKELIASDVAQIASFIILDTVLIFFIPAIYAETIESMMPVIGVILKAETATFILSFCLLAFLDECCFIILNQIGEAKKFFQDKPLKLS